MQDYQDFGKFNSLRNTLANSWSNMSLSSCLLFTLMKQHLFTGLSSRVSIPYIYSPILFSCWYYDYLNEITNQLA